MSDALNRGFVLLASLICGACASVPPEFADQVYVNGSVYAKPIDGRAVTAFAVKGPRFAAVGDDATVRKWIGPSTRVIDLQGSAVIPGLIDAHAHYVRGALRILFSCDFASSLPGDQVAASVKACAARRSPGDWVTGGTWSKSQLGSDRLSLRALDAATPNNPVLLLDDTGHSTFANSRALEILGLSLPAAAANADVVRDAGGKPTGVLLGPTGRGAGRNVPPPKAAEYQAAVRWAVKQANLFGITTYAEARTDRATLSAYNEVDDAGSLSAHLIAYLQYETEFEPQDVQDETVRIRDKYRSPHVSLDFVKLYLDGVPPNFSAFMLDPYASGDHQHGADYRGEMRMRQQRIDEVVTAMDKAGISVKMHATGDGSVRAALDAVEKARRANGTAVIAHSIAHVGLVAPEDLPRFKRLNVVADIAPPIWIPGPYSNSMTAAIGRARYERYIPTADLLKAGATVVYGSDWPSIAASINPWPHLQSLVDRSIGVEQRITLPQALDTMTTTSAASLRMADRIGDIAPGKSADFVVLDRDPYRGAVSAIGATKPVSTVFEGREVYRTP